MVIRCIECDRFVGRFSEPVQVLTTVDHSSEASVANDVVACRSCGTLHEIQRPNDRAA